MCAQDPVKGICPFQPVVPLVNSLEIFSWSAPQGLRTLSGPLPFLLHLVLCQLSGFQFPVVAVSSPPLKVIQIFIKLGQARNWVQYFILIQSLIFTFCEFMLKQKSLLGTNCPDLQFSAWGSSFQEAAVLQSEEPFLCKGQVRHVGITVA